MGIKNILRLLKAFLFGFTGLFIMITLISLLITANVRVSRAVAIANTSNNKINEQIANLKNWKNWHPIFKAGIAEISYGDSISGKNKNCTIRYNNKVTHLKIIAEDTTSVRFLLQSDGENDSENEISFNNLTSASEITVEYRALTHLNWYPWEKFYAIFIDKITGPGYEAALNGLKEYLEKNTN